MRRTLLGEFQDLADTQLSVRQLVYLAVVVAVTVVLPYLTVGLIWASTHYQHLSDLHGPDKLFSALGEVVAWPVLIIADVCLR